jgi:Restriction endonuclease
MPARTNSFQAAIVTVERLLATDGIRVAESALLPEPQGGSQREIDILLEGTLNNHPVRIAIECRDHAAAQDVTWIDDLIGKYASLPVDTVVAVSRSGFSAGALQKASLHGIRTLSFDELTATEWPRGLIRPGFRFVQGRWAYKGVSLHLADTDDVTLPTNLTDAPLFTLTGEAACTVGQFVTDLVRENAEREVRKVTDERAKEVLVGMRDEEFDLTIHLYGGGKAWPLPGTRFAEIKQVDLVLHVNLVVVTATTRHYTYNGAVVSVGTVPSGANSVAAVIVQDPKSPGSARVELRQGDPESLPG